MRSVCSGALFRFELSGKQLFGCCFIILLLAELCYNFLVIDVLRQFLAACSWVGNHSGLIERFSDAQSLLRRIAEITVNICKHRRCVVRLRRRLRHYFFCYVFYFSCLSISFFCSCFSFFLVPYFLSVFSCHCLFSDMYLQLNFPEWVRFEGLYLFFMLCEHMKNRALNASGRNYSKSFCACLYGKCQRPCK